MGDIMGDMNKRRGRIMGMNQADGMQKLEAEAPLAEMFKYATDLRSMTQARGYLYVMKLRTLRGSTRQRRAKDYRERGKRMRKTRINPACPSSPICVVGISCFLNRLGARPQFKAFYPWTLPFSGKGFSLFLIQRSFQ